MVHFVNAAGASVLPFSKHRYQVVPLLQSGAIATKCIVQCTVQVGTNNKKLDVLSHLT